MTVHVLVKDNNNDSNENLKNINNSLLTQQFRSNGKLIFKIFNLSFFKFNSNIF